MKLVEVVRDLLPVGPLRADRGVVPPGQREPPLVAGRLLPCAAVARPPKALSAATDPQEQRPRLPSSDHQMAPPSVTHVLSGRRGASLTRVRDRRQPLSISFSRSVYIRRAMGRGRVTIGDVAAQAGVSVATVSKVINDRYGVAEDTSARVRAVIDELGYEASLVGQSLRSRRTNVIGVLVADIEPFSAELLKGVARGDPRHGLRADRLLRLRPLAPTRPAGSAATSRASAARSPTARSSSRRAASTRRSASPVVAVDHNVALVDAADRRLGQPERRGRRDRVPDRPRTPPDRLPRRPPRPRVGAPARARLPAGARHGAASPSTRASSGSAATRRRRPPSRRASCSSSTRGRPRSSPRTT